MIVKYYNKYLSPLSLSQIGDLSGKFQSNKENSFTFTDDKHHGASFCEIIDREEDDKKRIKNIFLEIESVDKDNKVSANTMESYLSKISVIPNTWRWWDRKNLKNVIADHVKGFRKLTYSSLDQINTFAESFHVKTDVLDTNNGEVYADTAQYLGSDNELYYYSDGYIVYRIEMPTEALRQGLVLRWKDSVGTTTDISVQFQWSNTEIVPTTWSVEESPIRAESIAPNETEGVDIPESEGKYLFVRFNLKYDTGSKDEFPKGINYENEITTVDEGEKGNVVYHGKTAILYGFEVIYRVDTLLNAGVINIDETKILTADISDQTNNLDSLKAICEAYGYVFEIEEVNDLLYLNCYESYNVDRTNDTFVSDRINSIVKSKDDKRTILEAVEAYGAGTDFDKIHTFVSIVDNPKNISTYESETADMATLEQEARAYIEAENNDIVSIKFEYYGINLNLYDKIRIQVEDTVFTSTITEVSYNLTKSSFVKEYTVGIKQSVLSYLFNPIFSGGYIPIIETPTNIISRRSADGWIVSWTSNYSEHILEYKNETDAFWKRIYVPSNSVTLPFTEYKKLYSFRVYAVKDGFLSSVSRTTMFESGNDVSIGGIVDGSADIGFPDAPTITYITAEENGLKIKWLQNGSGLNNSVKKFIVTISKNETDYVTIETNSDEYFYNFNRDYDGYPERNNIDSYRVSVRTINTGDKVSQESSSVKPNTDTYGTWIVQTPTVTVNQDGRTSILSIVQPPTSSNEKLYGNVQNIIQIRKPNVDPSDVWFMPSRIKDPYASEANYKDGSGFIYSYESYAQTLPLTGQNNELPSPKSTTYQYKIIATNEAGTSSDIIVNVIALATDARDIVDAAITANKIAIDAVTEEKILDEAITETKIKDESITTPKMQANSIDGDRIKAGTLDASKITSKTITAEQIDAGTITASELYVEDLASKTGILGTISGGAMTGGSSGGISEGTIGLGGTNYWVLSGQNKGDFFLGNTENGVMTEGIRFSPGEGLLIKAKKMLVDNDKTSFEDELDVVGYRKDPVNEFGSLVTNPFSTSLINAMATDGQNIFCGGASGKIAVYNIASESFGSLVTNPFGSSNINAMATDGQNIFCGGASGKFAVYNIASESFGSLVTNPFGSSNINAMATDGQNIFCGGASGKFAVYNIASESFGELITTPFDTFISSSIVTIATDGINVFCSCYPYKFAVYNIASKTFGALVTNSMKTIVSVAIDGTNLYCGCQYGEFAVYNIASKTFGSLVTNPFGSSDINSMTTDGQNVFCGAGGGKFAVYNIATETFGELVTNPFSTSNLNAMATDGQNVFCGAASGKFAVYTISEQNETAKTKITPEKIEFFEEGVKTGELGGTNSAVINDDIIAENMALSTSAVYGKMTDCILKAGLNIDLEWDDTTVTLKAGSEIFSFVNNRVYTITVDQTTQANVFSEDGFFLCLPLGYGGSTLETYKTDMFMSGEGAPSSVTWSRYLDTTTNEVYSSLTGKLNRGCPVAQVKIENGKIVEVQKLDSVSYFGKTKFVLPGAQLLCPSGFNSDGTLKNTLYTVSNLIKSNTNVNPNKTNNVICQINASVYYISSTRYIQELNRYTNPAIGNIVTAALVGTQTCNDEVIISMDVSRPVELAKLNDKEALLTSTYSSSLIEEKLTERDDAIDALNTQVEENFNFLNSTINILDEKIVDQNKYQESEVYTGKTWAGRPVYRRSWGVFMENVGGNPASYGYNLPFSASDIFEIFNFEIYAYEKTFYGGEVVGHRRIRAIDLPTGKINDGHSLYSIIEYEDALSSVKTFFIVSQSDSFNGTYSSGFIEYTKKI